MLPMSCAEELELAMADAKSLLSDGFLKDVLVPSSSQALSRKYSDRDLGECAREKCDLAGQKLSVVFKAVQKMQWMHEIQNS